MKKDITGFGEELGTNGGQTSSKVTPIPGTSQKSFCSCQQTAEEWLFEK